MPALQMFQYPLTDRLSCNLVRLGRGLFCFLFQYPLTDRLSCNSAQMSRKITYKGGFSILSRIVFPATESSGSISIEPMLVFQYPLTDRLSCNSYILRRHHRFRLCFSILSRIVF